MAVDTFIVYVGVYADVETRRPTTSWSRTSTREADLIDAYDAAVIERRRRQGQDRQEARDADPGRRRARRRIGLATGLVVALFPFAAIGGGLLAATAAGGAVLGAVAGHAAGGMSRHDLKELGEHLDAGRAGLVVVAVPTWAPRSSGQWSGPQKLEHKELKPTPAAIEGDAKSAAGQPGHA